MLDFPLGIRRRISALPDHPMPRYESVDSDHLFCNSQCKQFRAIKMYVLLDFFFNSSKFKQSGKTAVKWKFSPYSIRSFVSKFNYDYKPTATTAFLLYRYSSPNMWTATPPPLSMWAGTWALDPPPLPSPQAPPRLTPAPPPPTPVHLPPTPVPPPPTPAPPPPLHGHPAPPSLPKLPPTLVALSPAPASKTRPRTAPAGSTTSPSQPQSLQTEDGETDDATCSTTTQGNDASEFYKFCQRNDSVPPAYGLILRHR